MPPTNRRRVWPTPPPCLITTATYERRRILNLNARLALPRATRHQIPASARIFWNKISPCGSDDTQALNRQVHSMGSRTFAEASNARANAFTQGFWRIRSSNLRPPLGVRHFLTELNFNLSPTTG